MINMEKEYTLILCINCVKHKPTAPHDEVALGKEKRGVRCDKCGGTYSHYKRNYMFKGDKLVSIMVLTNGDSVHKVK